MLAVNKSEVVPACGANWRKPGDEITDRAHRKRAHNCIPEHLPKQCEICSSKRNLVPDHKDGDESNDAPSNLRWLCKQCNTKLGIQFAAEGRGRRTHQYNPGNPGAQSLGAYVEAAAMHQRGAHDAGGKIIHETPAARRSEFAEEIWSRRRAHGTDHKNPMSHSKDAQALEDFRGFGPKEILRFQDSQFQDPRDFWPVGKLSGLWLARVPIPHPDATEAQAARTLDEWRKIQPHLYWKTPEVMATFDAHDRRPQLYFIGGNQALDESTVRAFCQATGTEYNPGPAYQNLGKCYGIRYEAVKSFENFRESLFCHPFGEEDGIVPELWYARGRHGLVLVGGNYRVETKDAELGASPGIAN